MKYYKFSNYLGKKIKMLIPNSKGGDEICLTYKGKRKNKNGLHYQYEEYNEDKEFKMAYEHVYNFVITHERDNRIYSFMESDILGVISKNIACIKNKDFYKILSYAGFDRKETLRLFNERCAIVPDKNGNNTNVKSINGKSERCVFFKIDYEI